MRQPGVGRLTALQSAIALICGGGLAWTPVTAQVVAQPPIAGQPLAGEQAPAAEQARGGEQRRSLLIVPTLSVEETYTTNVNLAPPDAAEDSFVTTVTPGITVDWAGARVKLRGSASVAAQVSTDDAGEDSLFPRADLLGTVEAIERFFFIEAAVDISQQYLSPFGPQPAGTIGTTDNRYTSTVYRVSPYLQGVAASNINYFLRNDHTWIDSNNTSNAPGVAGAYYTTWVGRLEGPLGLRFGWTTEFNTNYTKFTDEQEFTSELARAKLHYTPDPQWRMFVSGGYEENNYSLTDSEGAIYGVGFEWRPTERTHVVGEWESRFFGSSYLASITHRNPFTAINLHASRNVQTLPEQLLNLPAGGNVVAALDAAFTTRIPDPVQRAAAVQEFLRQSGLPAQLQSPLNFYTEQVELVEDINATFALLGVRNSSAVSVFDRKSEAISGGSGVPLPAPLGAVSDNRQRGGSFTFSHQLTPLTNVNATATRFRTTSLPPFASESTTTSLGVSSGTRVGPKTDGVVGARYTKFDSNLSNDYKELAVFAGLFHRF